MDFEVYCDESRQEYFTSALLPGKPQFVLIGSLWLEAARRPVLKAQLKAIREEHDVHGEFKWNRVSPSRQLFYTEIVNLFFDEPVRFRCIVLPAQQLDAVKFHNDDTELMFYKFYYQLLHHWILDFNTYHIFVDIKTNRVGQRLPRLREVLDRANYTSHVASVQALPSSQVDLIQLVDVLTGAVGFHFNADGTSSAKRAVLKAIEQRLGHPIQPTSKSEERSTSFDGAPVEAGKMPPTLIDYATEAEYRQHYLTCYCQAQIYTFDGIRVYFPQQQFDDAFYESANRQARDKSVFSWRRAERIAWIAVALADANAELYKGWDRDKRRANRKRRVIVVYGDYVVIIQIIASQSRATFITAYVADPPTLKKIRGMPRW